MSELDFQFNIIKKDGIHGQYWDSKNRQEIVKKLDEEEILRHISFSVEIEEDVVLKDIAKTVNSYSLLETFVGFYGQSEPWIKELNELLINSNYDYKTDNWLKHQEYIEIRWSSEITTFKNEKTFDHGIDIHSVGYKGFHWVKDGETEQSDNTEYRAPYGMTMTPAAHYANMHVRLNEDIECWDCNLDIKNTKSKTIFEATDKFSLLETLAIIYYELSWFGGPDQQQERIEDILGTKDQMIADLEDKKMRPLIERTSENGYDIMASDQVRDFLGTESNQEQLDREIRESAADDSVD
jgi:hypothetical protein